MHLRVLYYVGRLEAHSRPDTLMKKALAIGVVTGLALSALIILLRKHRLRDSEFGEFFDSSAIADELFGEPQYWYLRGGLAVYPANVAYGPYLHIDARGVRARWRGDTDIQELREATRARHRRDFP